MIGCTPQRDRQEKLSGRSLIVYNNEAPNVIHAVFALREQWALDEDTLFSVTLDVEMEGERRVVASTVVKALPPLVLRGLGGDEKDSEVQVALRINGESDRLEQVDDPFEGDPAFQPLPDKWIISDVGVYVVSLRMIGRSDEEFLSELQIVRGENGGIFLQQGVIAAPKE